MGAHGPVGCLTHAVNEDAAGVCALRCVMHSRDAFQAAIECPPPAQTPSESPALSRTLGRTCVESLQFSINMTKLHSLMDAAMTNMD